MPIAFLIIGAALLIASVRNTQDDLYALVKNDVTGPNNYFHWLIAILIIGALGYIDVLRPLSRMFLALIIVVLFLSHGGILEQFNQQLFSSTPTTDAAASDGSSLKQWLDSLTPNTPTGVEQPLAPARPH
jgi:hypothetical protein